MGIGGTQRFFARGRILLVSTCWKRNAQLQIYTCSPEPLGDRPTWLKCTVDADHTETSNLDRKPPSPWNLGDWRFEEREKNRCCVCYVPKKMQNMMPPGITPNTVYCDPHVEFMRSRSKSKLAGRAGDIVMRDQRKRLSFRLVSLPGHRVNASAWRSVGRSHTGLSVSAP